VVSRLAGQRLVLDMLTVTDEQVDEIAQAIVQATAGAAA
jgi:hypothetical protein